MKDRYFFLAVFSRGEDGGYSVSFPDLPGAVSGGDDMEDTMRMAKECLRFHLWGMEQDGDEIPEPSRPEQLPDLDLEPQEFLVLVEAWMPPFREHMRNRSVKKTLTIPKWLNDLAETAGLNFSQILQIAVMQELGVSPSSKELG